MSAKVILAGAPLALVVVLAVEAYLATVAEYLPTDPGYVVEATVTPQGKGGTTGPTGGQGSPVELVVLGDSTVAGVGSPSEAESLAVLVAERVAQQLGRPVHVVGQGVSGARTATVLDRQIPLLDATEPELGEEGALAPDDGRGPELGEEGALAPDGGRGPELGEEGALAPDDGRGPDVVLVVIGSNDVTHATPPWALRRQTTALVEAARQESGALVVLGGIPEFRTSPALLQPLRWIIGRYASVLRAIQRQAATEAGARFVDIATLASPRFLGIPEAMSSDGFHPSPIGYGFWADALAPAVAAELSGGRVTGPRGRPG